MVQDTQCAKKYGVSQTAVNKWIKKHQEVDAMSISIEERNKLVEDNLMLVPALVNRRFYSRNDKEDLIQIGYIGLIKAAELWNPTRGKFSTCNGGSVRADNE